MDPQVTDVMQIVEALNGIQCAISFIFYLACACLIVYSGTNLLGGTPGK